MSDVVITPAGVDALPDVMTIMHAAFQPRYGEAWTVEQCIGLLAMPGVGLAIARWREPLGFALWRAIAGECELMMLGVVPGAQRRGVGRRMLEFVTEHARNSGATAIFLEVRAGNPAAQLYLSAGFEKVGVRPRYYRGNSGEVFDAVTYRRLLI